MDFNTSPLLILRENDARSAITPAVFSRFQMIFRGEDHLFVSRLRPEGMAEWVFSSRGYYLFVTRNDSNRNPIGG
jgi:hypothetical protein